MVDITKTIGVELAKAIIYIGVGFVFGWISRGLKEKYVTTFENEKVIAILIAIVYVLSVLSAMVNPNYQTPAGLHAIMGIVAGYYYKQLIKK